MNVREITIWDTTRITAERGVDKTTLRLSFKGEENKWGVNCDLVLYEMPEAEVARIVAALKDQEETDQ